MKLDYLTATLAAGAMAVATTMPAFAGGLEAPEIEDEVVVIEEEPGTSGLGGLGPAGVGAAVLGGAALIALLGDSSSSTTTTLDENGNVIVIEQ